MTMVDERLEQPAAGARRPRTAILIAFGLLALVLLLAGLGGNSFQSKSQDVQKNDNSEYLPESADSTKVSNAAQKFNSQATIPGFVVYQRTSGLTDADKAKAASDAQYFRTGKINLVASDNIGAPVFSKDGTVASISVPLVGKAGNKDSKGPDLVTAEKAVLKHARDGTPSGLTVKSAGAGGLLVAFIDAFGGLDSSLLFSALIIVIVILLFVYRSPVLWVFPIICAVAALGLATAVIYGLAKNGTITLNGQSAGILDVLVLGAGTDYALLLISRYREELHEHESRINAMAAAWRGAAPPIGASAATVILGLICLSFADLKSTASLGPVCAIGIACTVAIMLTVLPAILVLAGRWVFWPRKPKVDHEADIATHGMWGRIAPAVVRHPKRSWGIGGVVLIACVIGVLGLKTDGIKTTDSFTNKPDAVKGQQIYDNAFPQARGAGTPADILVDADKADAVIAKIKGMKGLSTAPNAVCVEIDYAKAAAAFKANPAAAKGLANQCPTPQIQVTPHDGKTLVGATLVDSYDSPPAFATVNRLRSAVNEVPGAHALVGGSSATYLDIQNASRSDNKLIIPIVLLVILVVLGLLLRALLAPVLLIVSVVLSYAATLGVSSLFFNHVFHFANADPAFPLFTFIFLVALGIDYNIFLMTRVREETLEFGTRQGIVRGLAVTGGVITSAGVVLAATFVVLGVLPIVFLAEIGFAVAFGVLLDTILVRSIVVPALAYDIGKKIWWPSKLSAAGAQD
ncbi:MMPL family transporter [uncultured Jatrophihabitans sp.]|uniref:MMPL family transporter n=1 Tax=uncultured Jatrophihabitans sp. TaxID=1610747 RepID=UPI0035CAAED5